MQVVTSLVVAPKLHHPLLFAATFGAWKPTACQWLTKLNHWDILMYCLCLSLGPENGLAHLCWCNRSMILAPNKKKFGTKLRITHSSSHCKKCLSARLAYTPALPVWRFWSTPIVQSCSLALQFWPGFRCGFYIQYLGACLQTLGIVGCLEL